MNDAPVPEDERFGIFQSQLSRAWCLVYPCEYQETEWFNTYAEAVERFRAVSASAPEITPRP